MIFQFESSKLVLLIIIDLPTVLLLWWNVLISGTCHLTKYKWPQFFSQLSTYSSFWPKVCYLSSIYCQNLSTPIFMFIFMWVKCNILLLKANAYISSMYIQNYLQRSDHITMRAYTHRKNSTVGMVISIAIKQSIITRNAFL